MFDNGRVDDVFSDQYYTRFAHSLHQILEPWRPSIHPLGMFKKNLLCILICNELNDDQNYSDGSNPANRGGLLRFSVSGD